MDKKNNTIYIFVATLVVLFVYNIWFFLLTGVHTPSHWAVYAFTMIAFLIQIVTPILTNNSTKNSVYVNSSVYIFCIAYVIIQIALGWVFMFIPYVKITVTIELLIFSVVVVLLLLMGIVKNEVQKDDVTTTRDITFIKDLLIKVMKIKLNLVDMEDVKALEKLEEAIRYSDPVSAPQLEEVELELESIIQKIDVASKTNSQSIKELVPLAMKKLEERNYLCKYSK